MRAHIHQSWILCLPQSTLRGCQRIVPANPHRAAMALRATKAKLCTRLHGQMFHCACLSTFATRNAPKHEDQPPSPKMRTPKQLWLHRDRTIESCDADANRDSQAVLAKRLWCGHSRQWWSTDMHTKFTERTEMPAIDPRQIGRIRIRSRSRHGSAYHLRPRTTCI